MVPAKDSKVSMTSSGKGSSLKAGPWIISMLLTARICLAIDFPALNG